MSGYVIPLEAAVLGAVVALFVGLYVGVRSGRWSAGRDDWPPDDLDGGAW